MSETKNTKTAKNDITIGIDLGTTMSCVACMRQNTVEIIENRDGERLTPSVVCYDPEGMAPVVGSNAVIKAMSCPENFVYEAKRMFGRGFNSPEIAEASKNWSFEIRQIKSKGATSGDVTDNVGIVVKEKGVEKIYEPIQVSASVLNYLIESAKSRLGNYPATVVVTVPAYFTDTAKRRTLDAADIAFSSKVDANDGKPMNINTVLLAEPTAAAVAYGSIMLKNGQVKSGEEERILVFDLGGGTFDVSVLEFSYDARSPVGIVKAVDGDNQLGGADWDNRIVDLAKKKAGNRGASLSDREVKKNELRLRQEAIKVKTALSSNLKAIFNVSCYCGADDLTFELTRTQFERESRDLFGRLLERCKGVLLACEGINPVYDNQGVLDREETARIAGEDVRKFDTLIEEGKRSINRVIMVGGSSRIPKVKTILEQFFGETEDTPANQKKVVSPLNPDEAVAYGAAYYARSVRAMTQEEKEGKVSGAGEEAGILLIDNVPLNLNIETLGNVATPLIKAGTAVPCSQAQVFSTASDKQDQVQIRITQGNRARSSDNTLLGEFSLTGIQKAPRGVPQIEVVFTVDQNNVLRVTARDKETGSKHEISVTNTSTMLTDADIEEMKKAALQHQEEDRLFMERISLKNDFESEIYMMQDKVEQLSVPEDVKKEIKAKCAVEESWLKVIPETTDVGEIKDRKGKFSAEVAEMIQKATGGAGASGAAGHPDVEEVH